MKGDIVSVADPGVKRGEYRIAVVEEPIKGRDGIVRSCVIKYKNLRKPETPKYANAPFATIKRPVQRLAVILPVEESSDA